MLQFFAISDKGKASHWKRSRESSMTYLKIEMGLVFVFVFIIFCFDLFLLEKALAIFFFFFLFERRKLLLLSSNFEGYSCAFKGMIGRRIFIFVFKIV